MRNRMLLAAAILSLVVAVPGGAQTSCEWRTIDTDDRRSGNALFGIAVKDADRAWAAGARYTDRGVGRTYIRFWDGSGWQRQPTPNSSAINNQLNDIDAGRRGAVWAVGDEAGSALRTIALKKTSRGWKRTNTIDPSGSLNAFNHVAAFSRRHVWAVGTRWNSSGDHLFLIERWKRGRWRVVGPSGEGILWGVDASAPDDVWAVGVKVRNGVGRTATLHFNGRRWREVPSPNHSERFHVLHAVTSLGRGDAWAVGYRQVRGGYSQPLSMHWNGTRWRLVGTPDLGRRGDGQLRGISARGDDVVAVGDYYSSRDGFRALILDWTGSAWALQDTTNIPQSTELWDVDHAPNGEVFAAGMRTTSGGSESVLHRPAC